MSFYGIRGLAKVIREEDTGQWHCSLVHTRYYFNYGSPTVLRKFEHTRRREKTRDEAGE